MSHIANGRGLWKNECKWLGPWNKRMLQGGGRAVTVSALLSGSFVVLQYVVEEEWLDANMQQPAQQRALGALLQLAS